MTCQSMPGAQRRPAARGARARAAAPAAARAASLALLLLGAGACNESTGPDDQTYPPYTLAIRSGDEQTAPAGSTLDEQLQVTVHDAQTLPVKGVPVRFRLQRGAGAALGDTVEVTGVDGVASAELRLGTTPGDTVRVLAFVPGQEASGVTFRAVPTVGASLREVRPSTFASGDTVLLLGQHFSTAPAENTAFFGSARGRLVAVSGDTSLRVVVPPCTPAGSVPVRVEVASASTNTVTATAGAPSAGAVPLARFEAVTVAGTEQGNCLRLSGSAVYLLVAQLAGTGDEEPVRRQYSLSATSGGALASTGAFLDTSPFDGAVDGAVQPAPATSWRDRFDGMLRAREQELARTAEPPPAASSALRRNVVPEPPALGSQRDFRVLTDLDGDTFATTTARLRFAGTNVLLYEDEGAPQPLTEASVSQIGTLIDKDLYPIDVGIFGAESDIDQNGRVIILMTQRVNALTPRAECSQGFVAGFFYGFDLSSTSSNSNRAEIYYSITPDPAGQHSCAQPLSTVLNGLPRTFLHEFQHMISYNQHVLLRRGSAEDVWLNEGLSHIAEEAGARHYEAKYPTSRRTTASRIFPDSAVPFMQSNIDNMHAYLASPAGTSVTTFTDFGTIAERGAAWLFLRWLGAQKGEGIYSRLVQTSRTSRRNVETVAGETFPGLFGDYAIALFADSMPGVPRASVAPRYRFGDRNLRALLADRGYPYPLSVVSSTVPFSVPGSVVLGGAAYHRVTVSTLAGGLFRFAPSTTAGSTFPASQEAQLGVFRIQ